MALPPGATIGILGGGQLGRMLALAAAELGFRTHVYAAEPDAPACEVAAQSTRAPYTDQAALRAFARDVDVVTAEFENVPADTAETLARAVPVRPGPRALAIAQDRLSEKAFAQAQGLATAAHRAIGSAEDLRAALAEVGLPALLKTRRLGYDGKGQVKITAPGEAPAAFQALGGAPSILEAFVPFACEISVVLARAVDGSLAAYEPPRNRHADGILTCSIVPSGLAPHLVTEAVAGARRMAEALDYVGVMAVEFFVLPPQAPGRPRLLVNEIAPRVHNSGHWTQDACTTSQFEQHVRAVAGWPLGAVNRHADAVMENLIGADVERWPALSQEPAARLHLYGKRTVRSGRKMGHVTRLYPLGAGPTADE